LRFLAEVLELATAADPEMRAGGIPARRRRLEDLLDRRSTDAALARADPETRSVARRCEGNEDRLGDSLVAEWVVAGRVVAAGDVREPAATEHELLDPRLDDRAFVEIALPARDYPCPCFAASFAFFLSCRSLIERLAFFFSFEARSPFGIVVLLLPL
jgi:hypothetical protein